MKGGFDVNPFRTAVPFWGKNTWNLTGLSPKRDRGSKRVKLPTSVDASKYISSIYRAYGVLRSPTVCFAVSIKYVPGSLFVYYYGGA